MQEGASNSDPSLEAAANERRVRALSPHVGAYILLPGEERPGIPLKRPGSAHEIASLVAWLASPGADYATGHSFVVDGGLLLMAAVRND